MNQKLQEINDDHLARITVEALHTFKKSEGTEKLINQVVLQQLID